MVRFKVAPGEMPNAGHLPPPMSRRLRLWSSDRKQGEWWGGYGWGAFFLTGSELHPSVQARGAS
jgi:hypothetical protein